MLGQLLRTPLWRHWTLASLLARLPVTMSLLGVMLAVEEVTGSLGIGSQVVGTMTITAGVLGPWAGRRLDRREVRSGLMVRCAALSAGYVGMAALVGVRAPTWSLFAIAVAIGVALAGVWGGFRSLLVVIVPGEQRRHAHFVESLMIEISYGIGPLLSGIVVGSFGAVPALLLMAASALAATFALLRVPQRYPAEVPVLVSPLRDRRFAAVYAFGFVLGVAFGGVESNVAARMADFGLSSDAGGGFIALLALSSCIGGAWVSLRPLHPRRTELAAAVMMGVFAISLVPSILAGSAWWFGVALLPASLMLVPLNGIGAAEIEARANHAQRAEAFAYLLAATQMGSGLGVLLNGVVTAHTAPRWVPTGSVVLLATMGALLAMLHVTLSKRHAVVTLGRTATDSAAS